MPPETIHDDLLGNLTWDLERHEWHGRAVTARGLAFEFWVDTGVWDMVSIDDAQVARAISAASRTAFLYVRGSEPQVREHMVGEFVPLYADWHGGEQISPEDFQTRLQLAGVQILNDGAVQIFYGDDGMFGSHSLIAHLDSSGEFEHGEMFG